MKLREKYDTQIAGVISGLLLPLIIGLGIYVFTAHGKSPVLYVERILEANIVTHAISICVFPNVLIFLLFLRYDMLRAARGVLGMTILYAAVVFALKLF
jgi:hypothetical protein